MTYTITRILSATVLGALVTGCATVPGDPYYDAPRYPVYEQPGYIYSAPQPVYQAPPVYRAPGVIYSAPPPAVYYGGRDRDDNRWDNDRNRGDWRERERERDRAERDRAARERERRDQQAREADRRARESAPPQQSQRRFVDGRVGAARSRTAAPLVVHRRLPSGNIRARLYATCCVALVTHM